MSNNEHDKAAQEEHFADIFALLHEQDIEQFYAHYQLWVLRRRVPMIEQQVQTLREHLAEHQPISESLRPSALALAVLVRLQSNGVTNTDVLDLMLDRGEDWLDRMMQRLDYCEQVEDFIQGDYTQWCVKSLEGAYDWIDSLLGSIKEVGVNRQSNSSENAATEELLLQKLSLDDEEAMLEVSLKQSTTPAETATEVTTDDQQGQQPDEQLLSTASSKSDASTSQQEQILLPTENAEQRESDEVEAPELIGWKDLKDLKDLEEHPAPWYSVNVNANGASSTPFDAEQALTMDDWIQVLQADNVARVDAVEIPTDDPVEVLTSSELLETPEIDAPITTPESVEPGSLPEAIEAAEVPVNNPEIAELEPETETQGEIASILPEDAEAVQEQIILSPGETQVDEIPSEQDEELLVEENNDEHKIGEVTSSIPGEDDEDEQAIEDNTTIAEKPELTDIEQETGALASLTEEMIGEKAEASTLTDETMLADETTLNIDDTAELTPVQAGTIELANAEDRADETTDTLVSIKETTPISDQPAESVEQPHTQVKDQELSTGELAKQPEAQSSDLSPENGKVETSDEIETAAILNEILGLGEGQEEQLPWYEYLELDEPASQSAQSEKEAPITATETNSEKITEPNSRETGTTEAHEYISGEKDPSQSQVLNPVGKSTEPTTEIEGWQTWDTNEADDETLPLALKEIRLARQPQITDMPETVENPAAADTGDEISATSDVAEDVSTEINTDQVQENAEPPTLILPEIPEMPDAIEQSEQTVFATPEENPQAQWPVQEQSQPEQQADEPATTTIVEKSATAREYQQATRSKISEIDTIAEQVAVRPPTSVPQAQPPIPNEKPPRKPGFWRRLFGFGRKKQR